MPPIPIIPFLISAVLLALYTSYPHNGFASPQPLLRFLKLFPLLTIFDLFVWFGWSGFVYPKFISPLRNIPGPTGGAFLMGQFFENGRHHPGENIRKWVEEADHDGLIRFFGILNAERLVAVSPAAVADVLVHKAYDFQKPAILRVPASRILGVGLFLAEGDEHKKQRKALLPAFAFRHVKDLFPVFWAKSQALVRAVQEDADSALSVTDPSSGIEAHTWAVRATLDIIGVAGLGEDFGAISDPSNKLNQTYSTLFRPRDSSRVARLLVAFLPTWLLRCLPFKRNFEVTRAVAFIRETCLSLIQSKKHSMEKGASGKDILSVALASGSFSDDNLVDQMMTFLAAGHETTASSLTWAIYLLGKHTSVQTRLREEIHSKLPNPLDSEEARTVTAADIENLPYLNAFCQEVFRLYPPVPVVPREAVVNTTILDIPVPKGTRVMLSPWAMNTSKDLWGPDAEEFKPDRWLNSPSGGTESNYAFMTFFHGPRSCIGMSFAKAEFACLVAAWAGAFETELVDKEAKVELRGRITMKPRHGVHVNVKKAEW